jgi:hypothetical protein
MKSKGHWQVMKDNVDKAEVHFILLLFFIIFSKDMKNNLMAIPADC